MPPLTHPTHGKSQTIRGLDVFILGPFLVWAGTRKRVPRWAKTAIVVAGIATVVYNAANYARIAQQA